VRIGILIEIFDENGGRSVLIGDCRFGRYTLLKGTMNMRQNVMTKHTYKRRAASPSAKEWSQRGITIVELIVVLTISLLLIGVVVGAVVAWRNWSVKKQNDASAEEIFYAVQAALLNQSSTGELTEFERE
jgi:competence protein ComGC